MMAKIKKKMGPVILHAFIALGSDIRELHRLHGISVPSCLMYTMHHERNIQFFFFNFGNIFPMAQTSQKDCK